MGSAPEISVIIPVYNRAWSIGRAVESVLAQSFGDFELLLVDDGSSDELAAAVAAFKDPRLALLRHPTNRGAAAARNTGVAASRGALIAFLDSDDEWLPEKLARQRACLATASPAASLTLCGYSLVREGGHAEARPLETAADWYLRLLLVCNVSFGSCALLRREAFTVFGPLDETMARFEDWDWLLRYTAKAPIAALAEPLAIVHATAGWPSVEAVDSSVALIATRHRAVAAAHSPAAARLLRATADYERGVARYRHRRRAEAAWYLGRSLLLHPARLLSRRQAA